MFLNARLKRQDRRFHLFREIKMNLDTHGILEKTVFLQFHSQQKMEKMIQKILDREVFLERTNREQGVAKIRSREMRIKTYWILESMW